MICLSVFPYLAVSESAPNIWVIAIGVGSTLPCEIVTSRAAFALNEKNKITKIFLKK